MAEQYTDDELATLPQTETVFDRPELQIDDHVWLQQGTFIVEQCHDGLGLPIPAGAMLVKKDGRYALVDEITRQ